MPRLPRPLFPALGLIVTSCVAGLDIPSGTTVTCSSNDECPSELHCVEAFGRCVKSGDATAPTMIDAASPNPENIVLVFDEALDRDTAGLTEAYAFDPPLEVRSATPSDDGLTVKLLTVPQIGGYVYTAKAVVYDPAGNPTENTKQFTACCGMADTLAPNVLTPFTGQRFLGQTAVVSWSTRRGAHNYTIRASIDEDFHAPEVSMTVDASVTNVTLTVPTADSYYLEVIADVTLGNRAHSRVALLGDTVRVYCAPTEDCHAPAFAKAGGTIHDPFRTVKLAVGTVVTMGASTLKIASRGNGAYDEPLVMAGVPFNVRGGYAPDFNEATRDAKTFVTTLDNGGLTHQFSDLKDVAVVIDGVRFTNSFPITSRISPEAYVVRIERCSDQLTFDNCAVDASILDNSNALNVAFFVTDSVGNGPLIQHTSIRMVSDLSAGLVAFKFGGSVATLDDCAITMHHNGRSSADDEKILLRNSVLSVDVLQDGIPGLSTTDGLIENNTIIIRGNTFGVFATGDGSVIRNNIIMVNDGTGIRAQENRGAPLIAHNTVLVARGAGPPLSISTHARLIDNLVACGDTSVTTTATIVSTGADRPTSYDANAVVGCTSTFNGVTDPNTLNGTSCGTGCTSRYRGNLLKLADLGSVFADYDGPDNDVTTLEDNDLHLGSGSGAATMRSSGRSTSGSDCGSVEAPMSCGNVTTDIDGTARTPLESIGADQ